MRFRALKFDGPLRVNVLRGTIPANVFEEFKETQASPRLKLQHSASASLAKSFQDLRRGKAILDDGGNINDLEEDGEASKENSRDRNSSDKKDKKKKEENGENGRDGDVSYARRCVFESGDS